MTALERRDQIIDLLCEKRYIKSGDLANQFGVCIRTIGHDILYLSLSYPIYTKSGKYGGIFIAKGYYRNKSYLSDLQKETLESILSVVNKNQAKIISSIIDKFARPKIE